MASLLKDFDSLRYYKNLHDLRKSQKISEPLRLAIETSILNSVEYSNLLNTGNFHSLAAIQTSEDTALVLVRLRTKPKNPENPMSRPLSRVNSVETIVAPIFHIDTSLEIPRLTDYTLTGLKTLAPELTSEQLSLIPKDSAHVINSPTMYLVDSTDAIYLANPSLSTPPFIALLQPSKSTPISANVKGSNICSQKTDSGLDVHFYQVSGKSTRAIEKYPLWLSEPGQRRLHEVTSTTRHQFRITSTNDVEITTQKSQFRGSLNVLSQQWELFYDPKQNPQPGIIRLLDFRCACHDREVFSEQQLLDELSSHSTPGSMKPEKLAIYYLLRTQYPETFREHINKTPDFDLKLDLQAFVQSSPVSAFLELLVDSNKLLRAFQESPEMLSSCFNRLLQQYPYYLSKASAGASVLRENASSICQVLSKLEATPEVSKVLDSTFLDSIDTLLRYDIDDKYVRLVMDLLWKCSNQGILSVLQHYEEKFRSTVIGKTCICKNKQFPYEFLDYLETKVDSISAELLETLTPEDAEALLKTSETYRTKINRIHF